MFCIVYLPVFEACAFLIDKYLFGQQLYYVHFFMYIANYESFFLAKRYLKFNEEPSDVVVLRNKPAELRCNVTAKNGATIFWYKDDQKLDLSNDTQRTIRPDGSLYFKKIVRKKRVSPDAGVYRCLAETKVSDKYFKLYSQKARLSVAGKYRPGQMREGVERIEKQGVDVRAVVSRDKTKSVELIRVDPGTAERFWMVGAYA